LRQKIRKRNTKNKRKIKKRFFIKVVNA